jgi:general secretion pathway protein C
MQDLLRRYFWVVVVLTVMGSAFFAAKATSHVLEGTLLADPKKSPKVKPPAPSPSAAVASRSKVGQPLVDRNMFCAACLPPAPVTGPQVSDPNRIALTGLPLQLIATHVADGRDPKSAWNFATILNTGTQKQGAYWVDDDIPGAGKVLEVHYKYVDFKNTSTGARERVSLTGEVPPPPPPPTTVASNDPPPTDGDDLTAAIDAGIKKIDDTNYEIDRSLVDKVLANPMALAKGARVMLSSKNGEANGFKMYAVRPNSVFSKLGFSNGDTLNVVNGMALNSMDRAMEVYAKVRDASSIQVEITRRGKPVTLNYTIR